MKKQQFNSKHKAIKMPEGAAGEYAKYSCNFYKGCSNKCTYCFNNRWKWGDVPTLKKCFKNGQHALEIFKTELLANLPELQKHGLFFSFTTDPFLPETINLTGSAHRICANNNIPIKFLTKKVSEWVDNIIENVKCIESGVYEDNGLKWEVSDKPDLKKYSAFGFTLTGHDELEPNTSTNAERIEAMRKLHEAGFKTWASIEPVIDFSTSYEIMLDCQDYCDLFKVGLMSNYKPKTAVEKEHLNIFMDKCYYCIKKPIYFKDSLLQQAGINREDLSDNCVTRDYNMFNN